MNTAAERPSLVVSVFASMSALLGVPLGLVLFVANVSEASEAWLEGGWPMYAVLALGALAGVVNAVGAFFLTRGTPGVAGAGLFLSLLCGAIGVFGYQHGLTGSFEAVAYAAPMDRVWIMNGSVGEAMMCLVFGATMVGALLLAFGSSALIVALGVKEGRAGFAFFGLGLLAVGIWQLFVARGFSGEALGYQSVARASPADMAVLLFAGLDVAQEARSLASYALLGVVACCLAAGALLHANRRALVAVVGGLLVITAGLGGLRALSRPTTEQLEQLATPSIAGALMHLDGTPVDRKDRFLTLSAKELRTDSGAPAAELATSLDSAKDGDGVVNLRLEPDVTRERLLEQLGAMRDAKVRSVRLIGMRAMTPPPGLVVPAPFTTNLVQACAVRVHLVGEESCRDVDCTLASLDDKGLHEGAETFPLETKSFGFDGGETRFDSAIHLAAGKLTFAQLLSAAHTAVGQSRFLALHLP